MKPSSRPYAASHGIFPAHALVGDAHAMLRRASRFTGVLRKGWLTMTT
jgi:hypothetical protein